MEPPGGHGVYLDVRRFLPHLRPEELPGQALAVEIYREGGIRTVEVGSIMFSDGEKSTPADDSLELVRLAIPRRVYSSAQLDYVARAVIAVWRRRASVRGLRMIDRPARLPHFTARFAPLAPGKSPAEVSVVREKRRPATRKSHTAPRPTAASTAAAPSS